MLSMDVKENAFCCSAFCFCDYWWWRVSFCGNYTVASDFSTLSLKWWNLGPREDGALEVRQWTVCLFESKKKEKYNVWQSLPYTAQDRNDSVTGGERKHHSPSKIFMESVISSSLIGDIGVISLDMWYCTREEPNLRHSTSHRLSVEGLTISLFGKR